MLILPTCYIYLAYVRKWTRSGWLRSAAFVPAVGMLVYFLFVFARDDMHADNQACVGTFMFVFLTFTAPATLFSLLDAFGALVHRGRRVWRIAAMTLALFSILLLGYGYFEGRHHYVVTRQTVYFDSLPDSFDGYRLALFSDMHIGTYNDGHRGDVATIVRIVNEQHCDAILFAGDLVNFESRELKGYSRQLRALHAPDGVYSILGNHDYATYLYGRDMKEANPLRDEEMRRMVECQKRFGWHLLRNEHRIVRRGNDSIAIIGVENDGRPPFPSLGNLPQATRGLTRVCQPHKTLDHTFSILLSHDPTHWRRRVIPETNIDLTLSGHTHAGQFMLFGWSPVAFVYDEWSGLYDEGAQILDISNGIGEVMFPFRFGAWPEVNVITLRKKRPGRHPSRRSGRTLRTQYRINR